MLDFKRNIPSLNEIKQQKINYNYVVFCEETGLSREKFFDDNYLGSVVRIFIIKGDRVKQAKYPFWDAVCGITINRTKYQSQVSTILQIVRYLNLVSEREAENICLNFLKTNDTGNKQWQNINRLQKEIEKEMANNPERSIPTWEEISTISIKESFAIYASRKGLTSYSFNCIDYCGADGHTAVITILRNPSHGLRRIKKQNDKLCSFVVSKKEYCWQINAINQAFAMLTQETDPCVCELIQFLDGEKFATKRRWEKLMQMMQILSNKIAPTNNSKT